MIKKLTSLLGLVALGGGVAIYSTDIIATHQTTARPGETKKEIGGKLKLTPSNKFNVVSNPEEFFRPGAVFGKRSLQRSAKSGIKRIAAAPNVADSLLLYGLNYSDGTWQTLSGLDSKVYSFQSAPASRFVEASPANLEKPMAAFYAKGKFYLLFSDMETDENYNSLSSLRMKVYDASSWEELDDVVISEMSMGMDWYLRQVAAYDPTTNKAYTMSWGDGKPLISIDVDTYEARIIGGNANKFIQTMFVDSDGQLYGITFDEKKLYRIDKSTGAMEEVGDLELPFNISADPMSAVYDPAGKRAIWVAVDGNSKESALLSVDPVTAKVEKIADMPGNEHILGLYTPETSANAPAAPTKISYAGGKLCMKAPSSTHFSGEELSGALTIEVISKGKTIKELGVSPGEDVAADLPLADGDYHLFIRVRNAAGLSPERRLDTFVGSDMPCAVSELTLSMEDTKNSVLTWEAPDKSVHGGAIDDNSLNYRVVRFPDETVVAEGLKETSFTEPIPEAHARYYYEVTAFAGSLEGERAVSNVVTGGDVWVLPYTETFDTQADFDSFKVVDANNDLHTWQHMLPAGETSGYAYLVGNGTADVDTGIYEGNGNDDYLISPSVRLKSGVDYRMQFDSYDNFLTYEYLSIYLGKEKNNVGGEKKIFSEQIKNNSVMSFIFSVEEDGLYNFLFHGDNPGQSVSLSLDNISVDVYAALNGPDCAADVTATAGAFGKLENTLSFTLPVKKYNGESLDVIDRVEIYRNGSRRPVKTFDSVKPGEKITWLDTEVEQGMVNYRILVFNSEGQGKEALVSNWVGVDQPALVGNPYVRMNDDFKAVVTFDKVGGAGMHGGYVNPEEVTYALFRYNQYNWSNPWEQVSEFSDVTEIVDKDYFGWGQAWVDYAIVASNSAGLSEGCIVGLVLGEPYARPYSESFAMGFASLDPWTLIANSYEYAWNVVTGSGVRTKPYDNDGGMLQFAYKGEDSNSQRIIGPRISLKDSASPLLSFYMTHGFEAEEEDLLLDIYLNYADEGWVKTATVPYNNGTSGWGRYAIPLRADADNVQVAFGAYAADASAAIYVDAITIEEGSQNDVAIQGMSVDRRRINAGESYVVDVTVANYGMRKAENLKVALYDTDNEIMSGSIASLEPNDLTHVAFEVATTRKDASRNFVLTSVVSQDGDSNLENNTSDVAGVYVKGSVLPGVGTLEGVSEGDDVVLTWQKPSTDEVNDAVTDDFEAYESFIIDGIGDWTTYDGDGTQTVYFGGPEVPNNFAPKAWQVWAPEEAGFSLDKFEVLRPYSGDKYLACWAASDGYSTTLPNDDWLISSEVIGGTDVSFMYRMPNDGSDPQVFEMLYSTTDNEPENFTAFDSGRIDFGTDWIYFEFTLPSDARYFAIRSCSTGSYTVALLDDITFTPLYGSATKLELAGYNVYRDDKMIAENVKEESFTDKGASGTSHEYHVTANWKEGESNYSNPFENKSVGISSCSVDGVRIRAIDGAIEICGADGMAASVFSAQGIAVYNTIVEGDIMIRVVPGVYLVNVNEQAVKVIVR